MYSGENNSVVSADTSLKDAIVEMSKKALGIVCIADGDKLLGVFTDGDLRKTLAKGVDVYTLTVKDVMIKDPFVIDEDALAIEALHLINEKRISALPVVKDGALTGVIRINDITKVGIVG
jgi:arabinose-5-phosphate isomerase